MTHTFVELGVSQPVFAEIARKLKDAGYDHAFVDGAIDMHGVGLTVEPPKVPERTAKPLLCLDFDGVIHSYASGWKGADVIPDPPVPGALQFIAAAVEHFTVAVYSSRSGQPGGVQAMQQWLGYWSVDERYGMPSDFNHGLWGEILWPLEKPAALVTLDDRAITFTGHWPSLDWLRAFKPWNKR